MAYIDFLFAESTAICFTTLFGDCPAMLPMTLVRVFFFAAGCK